MPDENEIMIDAYRAIIFFCFICVITSNPQLKQGNYSENSSANQKDISLCEDFLLDFRRRLEDEKERDYFYYEIGKLCFINSNRTVTYFKACTHLVNAMFPKLVEELLRNMQNNSYLCTEAYKIPLLNPFKGDRDPDYVEYENTTENEALMNIVNPSYSKHYELCADCYFSFRDAFGATKHFLTNSYPEFYRNLVCNKLVGLVGNDDFCNACGRLLKKYHYPFSFYFLNFISYGDDDEVQNTCNGEELCQPQQTVPTEPPTTTFPDFSLHITTSPGYEPPTLSPPTYFPGITPPHKNGTTRVVLSYPLFYYYLCLSVTLLYH